MSVFFSNANGVPLAEGKTLHMNISAGDLANRVITVGSPARAQVIAAHLDASHPARTFHSSRGFTTITGFYKGVSVSIVAIGMGPSMMDFFVRESRAVVTGPMAMIRFGTCGGLTADTPAGCVVVSSGGSGYITRNPDAFPHNFTSDDKLPAYTFYNIAPASIELSTLVFDALSEQIGADGLRTGVNVTADSFYSSQGRIDDQFHDDNHDNISAICARYPEARSLEMESFMLLHLAQCCKVPIHATAAAIVLANRPSGDVIEGALIEPIESKGGLAMLEAIIKIAL